jgi:hypothetical protein
MNLIETCKSDLEFLFNQATKRKGKLSELASRGFVLAEAENQRILFVGINPSYPEGEKPESYTFKPHEVVERYSRYYKKFQDLADECNMPKDWTYLDLLQVRETDQQEVMSLIKDPAGLEFICGQLRVSMTMMENLKPDLIVVCNSGARPFFGIDHQTEDSKDYNIWMGYQFEFNEQFGVDVITGLHDKSIKKGVKSTKLVGTPVLFSSVLTYTDKSTRKRLAWQMRNILKYYELFFGAENYTRSGNRLLSNVIFTIVEQISDLSNKKIEAVTAGDYERAANCRDDIHQAYDELVNVIKLNSK